MNALDPDFVDELVARWQAENKLDKERVKAAAVRNKRGLAGEAAEIE